MAKLVLFWSFARALNNLTAPSRKKLQMHALRIHCIVIFKGLGAVWLFKGLAKTSEIRRANRKISVCNEHEKD